MLQLLLQRTAASHPFDTGPDGSKGTIMSDTMAQAQQTPTQQWVSFVLGEQRYAVNVLHVKEVLRPTEITPVSGAPGFVLGIINLRGNVVTVIDARHRFGLSPRPIDEHTRIMLIENRGQGVGVLVDRIGQVLNISPAEISAVPSVANEDGPKHAQGLATLSGELVVIVDLDKLLPKE